MLFRNNISAEGLRHIDQRIQEGLERLSRLVKKYEAAGGDRYIQLAREAKEVVAKVEALAAEGLSGEAVNWLMTFPGVLVI